MISDQARRLIGSCLCRRYATGGIKSMLDPRPISERERQKTLANPPTRYHWTVLCMDSEHAFSFERRITEICQQ